ncbi:uncharacterized protein [Cherax quadricarinatus]|uniref:uncharacterized protein n=1 Tax=Cherax quadricarinatus TaxID=27406 RepID=UPI00387E7F40
MKVTVVYIMMVTVVCTLVHQGDAVQCYEKRIADCGGSCYAQINRGFDSVLDCDKVIHDDGEIPADFGFSTSVYCNYDLCNSEAAGPPAVLSLTILTFIVIIHRV